MLFRSVQVDGRRKEPGQTGGGKAGDFEDRESAPEGSGRSPCPPQISAKAQITPQENAGADDHARNIDTGAQYVQGIRLSVRRRVICVKTVRRFSLRLDLCYSAVRNAV